MTNRDDARANGRRQRRRRTDTGGEERFRLIVDNIHDYAILMLDPQGRVVTWNAGAESILGYGASEILGEHFSRFYPPEAIRRGWPDRELQLALAQQHFEDEGWRVRKDGSRFWANVVITAMRDDAGELIGFSKISRDLTERRKHEEALRQSEEYSRLLVEGVKDYAIFRLDPDGRVMSWNAGAQRIKGYRAEEIIGRHFSIFYPSEAIQVRWPDRELVLACEEGRFEDENWRLRKDGTRFWANVVITPLHDSEGRLLGFAKVTRDMTQRRRIDALEQSERQTNEFLAMLAHELRNPLAPIRNAIEVMRTRPLEDPSLQWSRDVLDRQTSHLTRLVDDLLDVSRITSGKIALRTEPLEMAVVLDRALESSRPLLEARRHQVEVAVPPEGARVEGDLTRLAQVFLNLINNAAKYTPPGGRIRVSLEHTGSQAMVRVWDNGIGMSPDLTARVFEPFVQGERGLERSEGGLGIGLTLVRALVEMHGGTVTATSEGPGHGSEFVVRLPAGAKRTRAPAPTAREANDSAARRILVVDDNQDAADSLALLLGQAGHEVRVVYDGPMALGVAPEFQPDIVILDLGLPNWNGYEVARRLRNAGFVSSRLVAITGYGSAEDRQRTANAGFAAHLVKPVGLEDLQVLFATLDQTRS